MKFSFRTTTVFEKEFKRLYKKYPSLKADLISFQENFEKEISSADNISYGYKKVRFKIKSKHTGKSGGARIITFETVIDINNTDVLLASIYDKSIFTKIDINLLDKI